MNATLTLMIGIPGSGKSFCAKQIARQNPNIAYVSRDNIRFGLLKPEDDYFAKEDEVFDTFVREIKANLDAGISTIADATFINKKSRKKLFDALGGEKWFLENNIAKTYILCDTPLSIAVERNNMREGYEKVPYSAIASMSRNFEVPEEVEGFCEGVIYKMYYDVSKGV